MAEDQEVDRLISFSTADREEHTPEPRRIEKEGRAAADLTALGLELP